MPKSSSKFHANLLAGYSFPPTSDVLHLPLAARSHLVACTCLLQPDIAACACLVRPLSAHMHPVPFQMKCVFVLWRIHLLYRT